MITIEETEAVFQTRLTALAETLQWDWMHVGRTGKYGAVGCKGTLGTGWPDLVLLRGQRLIFAELKSQKAPPATPLQQMILAKLSLTGAECYIWRPSGWPLILETLTRE